jgi:outer membrane receptor protein involved in Fe transport
VSPCRLARRSLALNVAVVLVPAAVIAQQPARKPAQPAVAIQLDALVVDVVTATKTAKKAEDVPAAIEVITAADIRRRGYRLLADVLNDLPDNHEDRGNWGIGEPLNQHSGMGFRFDTGQNLLLLFNGFRLNAFLPGNRFGGEEYLLDDIDRIEVLRGPGSALYGANAFTTVVNIITRGAPNATSGTLEVENADGRALSGKGSTTVKLGDSSFISTSFRGAKDDGSKLRVENGLFGDAMVSDGVDHAFDAQLSASFGKLSLFGKATNQRRRTVTGFNGVNPSNNPDLALSAYAYFAGAQYIADPTKHLQIKGTAQAHQDNWTEVGLIPMFETNAAGTSLVHGADGLPILAENVVDRNGTQVRTPFVIDGQGGDTRTLESELQLTWNYRTGNNVIFGVNVSQDRVVKAVRPSEIQLTPFAIVPFQTFTDDANTWLADPHAARVTAGLYSQADYDVGPFAFTLGGRLDRYTGSGALDQTYTEFNPRGGIVFKHASVGHLKLLYGSATRVPNGFETLSSVAILGTPANRPEHLRTLQALWLRSWGTHVRTELGSFRSRITNHLQTDADISDEMQAQGFIGQFRNVAAGEVLKSSGVNGRISVQGGRLGATANVTHYFNTDDGTGTPIAYIPMTMVNASVNALLSWVNVNVGANYRSTFTKAADDPRPPVASYVRLNSNLIVEPPRLPWALNVGVRNILDSEIRAPSSSRDFVNNFPGRGREVLASIGYKF